MNKIITPKRKIYQRKIKSIYIDEMEQMYNRLDYTLKTMIRELKVMMNVIELNHLKIID